MRNKEVKIYIPIEEYTELKEYSTMLDESVSSYIRKLIKNELIYKREEYDIYSPYPNNPDIQWLIQK